MTIGNIVSGIIGSIIATIMFAIGTKLVLGVSSFRGLKSIVRLIKDCYSGGIINIFPSRQSYIHHKDHGTETQYISRCKNKLMYIGYWLAHGTEEGDIIETLQKLILQKKDVKVILLNPDNNVLINDVAEFLHMDCIEMEQRIKNSLAKLDKMKSGLPNELAIHFIIKVHDIPLNASAFMLDYDSEKELRILVDYKIYNKEREKSYGIEFVNGNIAHDLCDSYKEISRKAKPYEDKW